jgi:hypothetical protein
MKSYFTWRYANARKGNFQFRLRQDRPSDTDHSLEILTGFKPKIAGPWPANVRAVAAIADTEGDAMKKRKQPRKPRKTYIAQSESNASEGTD